MSLDGKPTLSNEALYQKNWSSFVDDAISKHQRQERGGCAGGEGSAGAGRLELRDVMCLEEVLTKLESAEGGWIDYDSRPPHAGLHDGDYMGSQSSSLEPTSDSLLGRQDRQPPHNAPGLPPMFENPRPSFLASMYINPASFRAVGKRRPPTLSLDIQFADPCVALNPERCFSASPGTKVGQHLSLREANSQDGGGTGANKSALVPMSESEDRDEQAVDDDLNTTGFEQCGGVFEESGNNINSSRAVSVSEDEDRHCAASLSARLGVDATQESLPKLVESFRLAKSTVPPPVECTLPEHSQHGVMQSLSPGEKEEMQKSEPGQQPRCTSNDYGSPVQAVAVEATSNGDQLGAAAAERDAPICQMQGGDEQEGTDRFLEPAEEEKQGGQRVASCPGTPPQPELFREHVMPSQLSARLSATHIDEAGKGDSSGSPVAGLDDHPPENGLRSPRQLDFERKVDEAASGNVTGQPRSHGVSASLHSSRLYDLNNSVGSGRTSSSPAVFRVSGGSVDAGSMQTAGSASPESSVGSSEAHLESISPEGKRREPGDDEDDHARAHYSNAESPEMLRLGSASQDTDGAAARQRGPSFDLGSWEVGTAAAGRLVGDDVRCGEENEGTVSSLAQSPEGTASARERDSQAFGSMLSPAIGGFGVMSGGGLDIDLLSPLALARSLDESGRACGDDGNDDGCCCCRSPFPGEDGGDDGGLSPAMSARSGSEVDSGTGPSPSQQPKEAPFAEEAEDGDDEDMTLTPGGSRSSEAATPSPSSAVTHIVGGRKKQGEERDCDWGSLETGANMDESEEDGSGFMLAPPPRPPSLTPRRKQQQRQQEDLEERRFFTNTRRARTAFTDRTNTHTPASAGRYDEPSRDEGFVSDHAGSKECSGGGGGGGGGCRGHVEQVSIGSFSESEVGGSRLESSVVGGGEGRGIETGHDLSLVEGTPRRQRGSSREDLGGFYPPLQVSNIGQKEPQGLNLSTLQRSTLQWMLWREGSEDEEEGGRSVAAAAATAATVSFSSDDTAEVDMKGGVLGHLSSEEASRCVYALLHENAALGGDGAAGGKADRARPAHPVTGLPRGATLIVTPTKEAAWEWTNRLESGVGGLSVLSYVMPLRERRKLSAKQAAAFDVVVTTYDVLKAKEVPRGVAANKATSPRIWALPGSKQWRTRNSKEEGHQKPAASKTDHMVSLLHGVWWDRVVADGTQLLGNQRSARAVAALALVGTARWCVVERESMAMVENTSERMRCLTAFLRIPAEVAMVQAADKLFYHSRPSHVAPLHPRSSSVADNSLSLSEGDAGQSSHGYSQGKSRPPSRRGASGVRRNGKPIVEEVGGLSV